MPPKKTRRESINLDARKSNSKFGWCASGHHEQCRIKFTDWNKIEQECNCNCHN